jgi:putative PIN family toxin of toxin-antitoxin system
MRIVVDTNVLVRYLIRPSAAIRELIEVCWLDGELQLVTAPELIAELTDVLARDTIRAFVRPEEGSILIDAICAKAELLPSLGARLPAYTRDAKDDKFVACALAGNADYLVTLDNGILAVGTLSRVSVVTPQQLLTILRPACG